VDVRYTVPALGEMIRTVPLWLFEADCRVVVVGEAPAVVYVVLVTYPADCDPTTTVPLFVPEALTVLV